VIHETPAACFNCCDERGGTYRPFVGDTQWHMGLDASGQAHYACAECAHLLFGARPINTSSRSRANG
jgi:hypothetical protein